MNLLIELFRPKDRRRDAEYLYSLHENLGNDFIEKVFVFIEPDTVIHFQSDKLELIVRSQRPTYLDLFQFCNENLDGEVCVVANGDIIFNNSLEQLSEISLDEKFLALSRWEAGEASDRLRLFDLPSSQDCWIFQAPLKTTDKMDFNLGIPGCDNRIAFLVHDLGYEVLNPSHSIVTVHFHHSMVRTYTSEDRVPGPYCLVPPCSIADSQQRRSVKPADER